MLWLHLPLESFCLSKRKTCFPLSLPELWGGRGSLMLSNLTPILRLRGRISHCPCSFQDEKMSFLRSNLLKFILRERALETRLYSRRRSLTLRTCEFCCQTVLNMLVKSFLAPCIPKLLFRVWRPCKPPCWVTRGGIWASIEVTWRDLANCKAQTKYSYIWTNVSGSKTFCD